MVNPPWNHDNLDTWLYRRGPSLITQSKSSEDPSSKTLCLYPLVISTLQDLNKSCLSSPAKTKTTKTGRACFLIEDGWVPPIVILLDVLSLRGWIVRSLYVSWARWAIFATNNGSMEMPTRREDSPLTMLISKTWEKDQDSSIVKKPQ